MEHSINKFFEFAVFWVGHSSSEVPGVGNWKLTGTFDAVGVSVRVHVVDEPAGWFVEVTNGNRIVVFVAAFVCRSSRDAFWDVALSRWHWSVGAMFPIFIHVRGLILSVLGWSWIMRACGSGCRGRRVIAWRFRERLRILIGARSWRSRGCRERTRGGDRWRWGDGVRRSLGWWGVERCRGRGFRGRGSMSVRSMTWRWTYGSWIVGELVVVRIAMAVVAKGEDVGEVVRVEQRVVDLEKVQDHPGRP